MNVDAYQLVELTAVGPPIESCVWDCLYAPNITYLVSKTLGDSKGTRLIFTGPVGDYRVNCTAYAAGRMMQSIVIVTIKGTTPPPQPEPSPPDPAPPDPGPVTPPIDATPGLRVLVIYESADLPKMPPKQTNILYSQSFRSYLDQVCVKVGNQTEWRIWDKDTNVSNESQVWRNLFNRPRGAIPWIVINNGTTSYEGPLPLTVEETQNLVKKYEPVQRVRAARIRPARKAA